MVRVINKNVAVASLWDKYTQKYYNMLVLQFRAKVIRNKIGSYCKLVPITKEFLYMIRYI